MVRVIGTTGSAPLTAAQALVTSAQASVVSKVPDFIPAVLTGADPGLKFLHSHYTQDGVAPTNVAPDKGGDVGGCIQPLGSLAVSLVQRNAGCVVGP